MNVKTTEERSVVMLDVLGLAKRVSLAEAAEDMLAALEGLDAAYKAEGAPGYGFNPAPATRAYQIGVMQAWTAARAAIAKAKGEDSQ